MNKYVTRHLFVKRKGSSNTFFAAGIILLLVGMSMATNLIVLVPLSIFSCSPNQASLTIQPPTPATAGSVSPVPGIYCYDSATQVIVSASASQGYGLEGWCYDIAPLPGACVSAQSLIINLVPGEIVSVIPTIVPCQALSCANAAGSYTINPPQVQSGSGTTSVTQSTQTTGIVTTTISNNSQPFSLTDNQKIGILISVIGLAFVIMGTRREEK